MVENNCIEVDEKLTRELQRLSNEQYQALAALHRTLLHEHHDFFLASQHPSSSAALRRLAMMYAMPARMWRNGIYNFLELLRHGLLDSRDHMLEGIQLAYRTIALLSEADPSSSHEWLEILGELPRYRMAIAESDSRDHEIWSGIAQLWVDLAARRNLNTSPGEEHHPVFDRPTITRRPPENSPETQLPEDFSVKGLHWGQRYSLPVFSQGQDMGEDEEMLDMPSNSVAGPSNWNFVLRDAHYDADQCSGANQDIILDSLPMAVLPRPDTIQQLAYYSEAFFSMMSLQDARDSVMDLFDPFREEGASIGSQFAAAETAFMTFVPEVGTSELIPLQPPSDFDWQVGYYALAAPETTSDTWYQSPDQSNEDTSMPDVNSDEFLLPEGPEFSFTNPLNPLFNLDMTFSLDTEDPCRNMSAGDYYLVNSPDWNVDYEINVIHEVV